MLPNFIRVQCWPVTKDKLVYVQPNSPPDPALVALDRLPEKWLFDLPSFVLQRSKEAGLRQVYDCRLNTYDEDDLFFSHRRATHRSEPDSGRLISVITQS